MTEKDIINLVKNDKWMMSVLKEAEKLNLPDWMIGAGFIRNKVWDKLHDIENAVSDTGDIDLVYFDAERIDWEEDVRLSAKMNHKLGLEWEIRNQAYMHTKHNRTVPYKNTKDAISEWSETPTCVAVTLKNNHPVIIAPHGIDDLVNLIIRPVSTHKINLDIFHQRIKTKNWLKKWPKLRVVID